MSSQNYKNINSPFKSLSDGYLQVIDQTKLPFIYEELTLKTGDDVYRAIKDMIVRGAGVIGNVAAYGVYLSSLESNGDIKFIRKSSEKILHARPTAVNLNWAIQRMLKILDQGAQGITEKLKQEAFKIAEEEKQNSRKMGKYGLSLIEEILIRKQKNKINILTHCNAGHLAIYDRGSALAPIYEAKRLGIDIHVWVDETRPRNQGANLTAWELKQEDVDFTIIPDNTGGLLMQRGEVDLVFVGADRVTKNGDVINKIGTYLKALAAKDNNIPFYVFYPSSTFDGNLESGTGVIIEERDGDEIRFITGKDKNGTILTIQIMMDDAKVLNYGFDITPAKFITGWVTENGISNFNTPLVI